MYERFTDGAKALMDEARKLATERSESYVGTEHMLMVLLRKKGTRALEILIELGVSPEDIQTEVDILLQSSGTKPDPHFDPKETRKPHTPRAKKVIEFSMEEARNLKCNFVSMLHLLLGLVRANEAVASDAIVNAFKKKDETWDRDKILSSIREKVLEQHPLANIDFGTFGDILTHQLELYFGLAGLSDEQIDRLDQFLKTNPGASTKIIKTLIAGYQPISLRQRARSFIDDLVNTARNSRDDESAVSSSSNRMLSAMMAYRGAPIDIMKLLE